eukprot:TRINITY_DN2474_c0_g1_i1.p1 TRINITY_DN2474_c0_g1~~TRINITY_DN2474_c0_g1_i1.p1  ORF type:complete len:136 (-),score=16.14 TRINITY_DN2474_c0_g1_i1:191-598(-)
MALNGIWQLHKLVVTWCNWGGSSRGVREFVKTHLPAFRQHNPQAEIKTALKPGRHPLLIGFYRDNKVQRVDVRNMDPDEILEKAISLRNSLGNTPARLKHRHFTKHPSVQGTWKTSLKLSFSQVSPDLFKWRSSL